MSAPICFDDWIVSLKRHSTSFSPDRETVFSFDLEGRPISWYEAGRVFKRSLASEIHGRERIPEGRRRFRLTPAEAAAAFARLLGRLAEIPPSALPPEARARLDAILAWTPEALLRERERFEAAYAPVAILPPDQYFSVVLQATEGCSWNRCTFCSFYQDRPFRARPEEEFRAHARAVRALLGKGELLRRDIFLADGNALVLSNARLRPIFEIARDEFPGRGLHGFIDIFTGERKSAADWVELRGLGLERVYVGLETGHDPLLHWMNKPGGAAAAASLVATLKESGLLVSTIVMCGAGGDRFAEAHVAETLDLVSRMPLGEGDIVFLSPFVEHPGSDYARKAEEEGIRPLDPREREAQCARLRDGLRAARPGVKVARYDIREFVY